MATSTFPTAPESVVVVLTSPTKTVRVHVRGLVARLLGAGVRRAPGRAPRGPRDLRRPARRRRGTGSSSRWARTSALRTTLPPPPRSVTPLRTRPHPGRPRPRLPRRGGGRARRPADETPARPRHHLARPALRRARRAGWRSGQATRLVARSSDVTLAPSADVLARLARGRCRSRPAVARRRAHASRTPHRPRGAASRAGRGARATRRGAVDPHRRADRPGEGPRAAAGGRPTVARAPPQPRGAPGGGRRRSRGGPAAAEHRRGAAAGAAARGAGRHRRADARLPTCTSSPRAGRPRRSVVQEAMRAGLPVVATAVGGVPDLLGDTGVLVPPGDLEAFALEVALLLGDPARAQRLPGPRRPAPGPCRTRTTSPPTSSPPTPRPAPCARSPAAAPGDPSAPRPADNVEFRGGARGHAAGVRHRRRRLLPGEGADGVQPRAAAAGPRPAGRHAEARPLPQRRPGDDEPVPAR